jgi:DNA primase
MRKGGILNDERDKSIEILETLFLDVEELTDELRFSYQHSPNYSTNPHAFDHTNDTGDWIMSCCPNHGETRASFGISKDPPYHCNCFYCGYLGTVDKVIEIAMGLDDGEGLKVLLSTYMVEEKRASLDIEAIIANGREPIKIPCLDEQDLTRFKEARKGNEWRYDSALAYMKQRGFSDHTLETYGITVDMDNQCIVFPQRTRTGQLRFIQKRKIGNNYAGAKFINEGSPIKKDIVFGLHFIDRLKLTPNRIRRVRMVESPTDAMANYEAGYVAVALNGKLLFKNQLQELLLAGVEIVDLMLDNDTAGEEGAKRAIRMLDKAGVVVNRVIYPSPLYKDSNDLLRAGLIHQCQMTNINLLGGH